MLKQLWKWLGHSYVCLQPELQFMWSIHLVGYKILILTIHHSFVLHEWRVILCQTNVWQQTKSRKSSLTHLYMVHTPYKYLYRAVYCLSGLYTAEWKTKRAALTEFTLEDAEILRPAIQLPAWSYLNCIKAVSCKVLLLKHFQNTSSCSPDFQIVLIRTSFKPALSQLTETGQQMLQLAVLRLTTF